MMNHRFRLPLLVGILLLLFSAPALAQYVLIAGVNEGKRVSLFHVNGQGQIELPPYDYFDNSYEPTGITCSPTGKKVFFKGFNSLGGNVYMVDEQYSFHLLQWLGTQCAGSVFSPDEDYFLTSTSFYYATKHGTLALYKWNTNKYDLLTTQSVPTTATTGVYQGVWTKRDEVFSSSMNGYLDSLSGGTLYQFHRDTNNLEFKQYYSPLTSGIDHVDLSEDENLIAFCGRQSIEYGLKRAYIGTIIRNTAGIWEQKCTYRDPTWRAWVSAQWIFLVPHTQFAAMLLWGSEDADGSGLWLYWINPNTYQISLSTRLSLQEANNMAMSPDGKFFAVSHDFNRNISIIELDSYGQFHIRDTIRGPQIGCLAFLPQAFPPAAANDDCALYADTQSAQPAPGSIKKKSTALGTKPSNVGSHPINAEGSWQR